jgi:hypothetical protein
MKCLSKNVGQISTTHILFFIFSKTGQATRIRWNRDRPLHRKLDLSHWVLQVHGSPLERHQWAPVGSCQWDTGMFLHFAHYLIKINKQCRDSPSFHTTL